MKNKLWVILLLFLLFISLPVFSKTQTQQSKPFDISLKQLPVKFFGEDSKKLYTELENIDDKLSTGRDEFETQEEFQKRIQVTIDKQIKQLSAIFVNTGSSYDIDTETLTIDLENSNACRFFIRSFCDGKEIPSEIITAHYETYEQDMVGTNEYGVKVDVKEYCHDYYGIYLLNKKDKELIYTINLPRDKAKSLKENLGILLIGNIRYNEELSRFTIYTGYVSNRPTIERPSYSSFQLYDLYFELKQIWFYNTSTGVIVLKDIY